jgi:hypothetical protein
MRSDGRSAKQLVRFFVIGCVRDGLRAPCPPTLAKLRVLAFVLVKTIGWAKPQSQWLPLETMALV